ncbi:MAG: hypothetical protein CVT98_01840, partial [Bacteroidetes bacterium HGW-Bacteroidetes-15]
MYKLMKLLASPLLMAVLIIAFGVASAIATFIENDFGTQAARAIVYNAWWFELIMFLLTINFSLMIFTRKLYRKEKLSILLFHIGFIVILIGAGVTRYFGQEGMMHIREGETTYGFTSTEKWLNVFIEDDIVFRQQANFTPVTRNRFNKSIDHNNAKIKVSLSDYIPHAVETVVEHFDGYPVVSLVVMDSTGSVSTLVRPGMIVPVGITGIGFQDKSKRLDIEMAISDSGVVARSVHPVAIRQMPIEEEQLIDADQWFLLKPQTFYNSGKVNFAYRGYWPS